jgi:hypothetical protein
LRLAEFLKRQCPSIFTISIHYREHFSELVPEHELVDDIARSLPDTQEVRGYTVSEDELVVVEGGE